MQDPFKNAMQQLNNAAKILKLNQKVLTVLKGPKKVLEAKIPVKMDNGSTKLFQAYRVQYNNTRGPFKGGIRFHPKVNLSEIKALSFWMTIKPAVITGKSVEAGGSLGRDTATADGGFFILETLAKKLKIQPKKTKMIVQGFGNVGANFAHLAYHAGYKIIGVSDSHTGLFDQTGQGLDYHIIEHIKRGSKGMVDICDCHD